MNLTRKVTEIFKSLFNSGLLVVRAPGRVNIIGEHTGYNEGFVISASIDKAIYAAAGKRNDNHALVVSFFRYWRKAC
jgi:galactokinase